MTMPVSGNINGTMGGAPLQATVNFNVPIAPTPAPPIYPPAVPTSCFLCCRKPDQYPALAVTVYNGTYLCRPCVQSLPDQFLINEFPPNLGPGGPS